MLETCLETQTASKCSGSLWGLNCNSSWSLYETPPWCWCMTAPKPMLIRSSVVYCRPWWSVFNDNYERNVFQTVNLYDENLFQTPNSSKILVFPKYLETNGRARSLPGGEYIAHPPGPASADRGAPPFFKKFSTTFDWICTIWALKQRLDMKFWQN